MQLGHLQFHRCNELKQIVVKSPVVQLIRVLDWNSGRGTPQVLPKVTITLHSRYLNLVTQAIGVVSNLSKNVERN